MFTKRKPLPWQCIFKRHRGWYIRCAILAGTVSPIIGHLGTWR